MLIMFGALLTILGLCGILYALFQIVRAKRAKLSDEEIRARLAKLIPVNLAALFLSFIGLMVVVVGILIG